MTSIGNYAFEGCSNLTSITVASENTVYDSRDNCNAIVETASNTLIAGCKNTVIPNSVTSIGVYAFEYCSGLTSITIPNSVISIGDWAFYNCSGLTSITIPNSVTSIGMYAFDGTAWYDTQPDGVVYADNWVYIYKGKYTMPSNTTITLKEGTVGIADGAFAWCSDLTAVTIPNGVTSIGDEAFQGCTGLTAITIPNSVTNIGDYAFSGCSGLTSVTTEMTTPFTFGSSAFNRIGSTCKLYVPVGTKDTYIANGWTEEVFQGGIFETDGGTEAGERGDVNGDGELNISDLTALVNMILGKSAKSSAADVNDDAKVDISDVTALVNMILGK